MHTHNENTDREDLKQVIEIIEAKQREKARRERAEITEENRLEKEAEKARSIFLAERANEKEVLGAEILEKVKLLGQDKLIRKFRSYEGDDWGGFVPIHEREITNPAELRPDMPTEREVTEYFQLSSGGVLVYNQIYTALHFAEGMMQSQVRRDPNRYGIKLAKPTDFRKLSITAIEAFLKALNEGQPYKYAAKRITRLVEVEFDQGGS